MVDAPECICGSKKAGLIYIPARDQYQCGDCICKAYAVLSKISKITLNEDPLQGVRSMNKLSKAQDDTLKRLSENLAQISENLAQIRESS